MTMTAPRPAVETPLAGVRLLDVRCKRCDLPVKVIAIGTERLPVFLDITPTTVVTAGGRVHAGYPVHDEVACAAREAART